MSLFSRLFTKTPADLLAKGDRYMESQRYFDARTCYEEGLRLCSSRKADENYKTQFIERIDSSNRSLAELNIQEAEHAKMCGDSVKAVDHLELVKTLTYDSVLRNKAENMLLELVNAEVDSHEIPAVSSCGSCSGSTSSGCSDSTSSDDSLMQHEYYELLIQQLPVDLYQRYSELGEDFAYAYMAASRDEHEKALSALDNCLGKIPDDIYWCEKGKVLHRLGEVHESEQCLRAAVQLNSRNSIAWLALALAACEGNKFEDALTVVDTMVAGKMLVGQALMIRAEALFASGSVESAIDQYVELLETPYVRAAAEGLHELLVTVGRLSDAEVIVKKYLSKSCH